MQYSIEGVYKFAFCGWRFNRKSLKLTEGNMPGFFELKHEQYLEQEERILQYLSFVGIKL